MLFKKLTAIQLSLSADASSSSVSPSLALCRRLASPSPAVRLCSPCTNSYTIYICRTNFFEKLVRLPERHGVDVYFPGFVMAGCGIGSWSDGRKALTLCHGDCHTGTEILCGVLKCKTHVYITYIEVLRTLNGPKRNTAD